ncbi:MAG: hypothetical protein WKF89_13285, partial [Chitinophagaceae bacterium]
MFRRAYQYATAFLEIRQTGSGEQLVPLIDWQNPKGQGRIFHAVITRHWRKCFAGPINMLLHLLKFAKRVPANNSYHCKSLYSTQSTKQ